MSDHPLIDRAGTSHAGRGSAGHGKSASRLPRDPDRKGKVEAGVGHAQKTPLRGLRFKTLEAGQAYLDRWETYWADTRIHGTTKRQVAARFLPRSGRRSGRWRSNRFRVARQKNCAGI
jgi:hypothetical protein